MSFDKPSSATHWNSSLGRSSDKQNKPETGNPASVWGQTSRGLTAQGTLPPLATSGLSSTSAFGQAWRPSSRGDLDSDASRITPGLPPVVSNASGRFTLSRRPTTPQSAHSQSSSNNHQAGAIQQPNTFVGRPFTSPRSRAISPLSALGGAPTWNNTGSGAAAGGGTSSGPRSGGLYSPSIPGTGLNSPTSLKFERSPSISSNPNSSSASKISATQIVLLVDTITEKKGQLEWESKADKIRKLLDTNGMEVFTQYFRRLVSSNASAIFDGRDRDHGSYKLLQQEMDKVALDVEQASKIAEAIDTSREDIYKDFDLIKFTAYFHPADAISQVLLATAFTRCTRADLRNKANKVLAEATVPCIQQFYENRTQLHSYSPKCVAAVIEQIALSSALTTSEQKADLFWTVRSRYDGQQDAPADVVSALSLLRLPPDDQKIAKSLLRTGAKSTSSKQAVEDILHGIGLNNITDLEVSHALLFMSYARSQSYDISIFVSTIQSKANNVSVDWSQVVIGFDLPDLQIQTADFVRLFKALRVIALEDSDFDLQRLWGGQWHHPATQMSFLRAFLSAQPEDVGPSQIPNFRSSIPTSDMASLSEDQRKYLERHLNTQYTSLDAMVAILEISLAPELQGEDLGRTEILTEILHKHSIVFFLSLVTLKPKSWTALQEKVIHECFRQFIEKQRDDAPIVLESLYALDPLLVFSLCAIVFAQDPRETEFIYQRAEEFGWTTEFLKHWQNPLALDLACMRNKRNTDFDLDGYLTDVAEGKGPAQLGMVLCKYLRIKADDEFRVQRDQASPQSVPLSLGTVQTLLEKLDEFISERELVESAQTTCLQTYPRLINFGTGFDELLERSSEEHGNKLSKETDDRMSELFGRMYRNEVSIRDMVTEMKDLKLSNEPDRQDLFCCIVHGLFDEFPCYNEYPEDALQKTALLFGNIIKYKLLPSIPREYSLSLMLKAVRDNPPGSLMYEFGIEAILQICDQLPEWPGYCTYLLRIPTLRHPEIRQRAQEGLQKQEAEGEVNGNGAVPHTNGYGFDMPAIDSSRAFRSIHADPAPANLRFQDPDPAVQESVSFIINNLSHGNLESKVSQVRDSLTPESYQWFANYLVDGRAKLEANNQKLYCNLLALLDDRTLITEVLRQTYISIVKLINSDTNGATERGYLKNLGIWLGSLTLAQDKPIKHKNIYFVNLLIEGHETQRLVTVIPFTCKALTQAKDSMIFKPPNPWTMEIVQVLKELYEIAELKLNQKFEIEVLCKDLKLDIKKITAATIVRDHAQPDEDSVNISAMPDGLENFDDLSLNGAMNRGVRERVSVAEIMASLPNLRDVLKYPPHSGPPQEQAVIEEVVSRAFEQAIQEIIAPVVERSITIASISTAQLIAKDYANNADPDQYQAAARQMVKSLAGSLALVTCKEPLRMSITNWIRRPSEDIQESIMPEGAILMCVNDNLDTACSFVETAATDRAIPEIDHVIAPELEERRQFLAEGSGRAFVSSSANATQRWSQMLPEPYKQLLDGLSDAQRAVYEDFDHRVHGTNLSHTQNASIDSTGRQIPDVLQETLAMPNLSTPADQHVVPHQSPLGLHDGRGIDSAPQPRLNGLDAVPPQERVFALVEDMQKAARASDAMRLADLEKDNSMFHDFRQILMVITGSQRPNSEILARQVAEKVCNIFATKPPNKFLEAEILSFLLSKLCVLSEMIIRDVFRWVSSNEPVLLSNANVVAGLVAPGLMDLSRVDAYLADALLQREPQGLQILSELLDLTLFTAEPTTLRADFVNSLVAMSTWLREDSSLALASEINSKLAAHGMSAIDAVPVSDKVKAKQDQMRYIFDEWLRLFDNRPADASALAAFFRDMHKEKIVNDAADTVEFLRLAIDACIEGFEKEASSTRGSFNDAFSTTDALASFVMSLVLFQGESDGAVQQARAAHLESILSLLVLIINHSQNMHGVHFPQRVFNRLISSMLYELSAARLEDGSEQNQMIRAFGTMLKSLQPSWFPGLSFAWMSLIVNRVLVKGLLKEGHETGHQIYRDLTGLSLMFFSDSIRSAISQTVLAEFYRGILRNILVIHHDYPDFLSANYSYLCSRIGYEIPQLRNLILTCRPVSCGDLPDPTMPGLKIERLDEMKKSPELPPDFDALLRSENIHDLIEAALKKNADLDSLARQIYTKLAAAASTASKASPQRMIELINTLVPFIGQAACQAGAKFEPNGPATKLLMTLAVFLDAEQRYYLVNALADQIRFPNTHTDYFLKFVLHLWGIGANITDVQRELREQVCRVLLERISVARPHPWGITILSMELLNNSQNGFWDIVAAEGGQQMQARLQVAIRQAGH
jgi:CCR4-NOT transcription complex subunit 1